MPSQASIHLGYIDVEYSTTLMEDGGEEEKGEKETRQAKHKAITTKNRERTVVEVRWRGRENDAHRDCMKIVESSPSLTKFAFLPSSIVTAAVFNAERSVGERREQKKREGGVRYVAHNSGRGEGGGGRQIRGPRRTKPHDKHLP